jgi:hypothetical protein
MPLRHFLTAALASAAVTACASTPAVNSGPQPGSNQTAVESTGANRWTGSLNPTQSFKGAAVASERQKAYGTVELTVASSRSTLTHVRLTVSVQMEPGLDNLGWAIHPGNCGSGNPPVIAPGMFPMIVLSANGRGVVESDIPFTLPESGIYHVNVFRGSGTQLTDVMTCADLRKQS